jgi:hypothetical protein
MSTENRQRRRNAKNTFYVEVKNIPGGEDIWQAVITDWILNVLPEDMEEFKVEHMREAVEGAFEEEEVPEITDAQYEVLTDAFKKFVRSYYGEVVPEQPLVQGGRRKLRKTRKTRKHKKRSKKTRKH